MVDAQWQALSAYLVRCFPFCSFVFGGAEVEPKASCMLDMPVLFSVSTPSATETSVPG